jgi:acyl-CoA thioesterase-1
MEPVQNYMGRSIGKVFIPAAMRHRQPVKVEAEMNAPIKIMPFGDSITASFAPYSSYRCHLDHLLHAAGISFLYTGSRTTDSYGQNLPPCGNPLAAFDPHNEGYSGAMAWDFLHEDHWKSGATNTLEEILSRQITFQDGTHGANIPDLVLMHLGTNDLGHGHPIPQIISDLGSLIDLFRAKNPAVAILIAQIIPCQGADLPWCRNVPDLNAAIPGLAAQKSTLSSPVMVVDQYTGYNPPVDSFFSSNEYVHPNSSGDAKIAARWMEAIQKWLNRTIYHTFIPGVITP